MGIMLLCDEGKAVIVAHITGSGSMGHDSLAFVDAKPFAIIGPKLTTRQHRRSVASRWKS